MSMERIQRSAGSPGSGKRDTFIARAEVCIYASQSRVWDALVNPAIIRQYMFGAMAVSDWKEGSSIVWKGTWEGKPFEDKGVILRMDREQMIQYSHFSPLSGLADTPEHYHIVTIELAEEGDYTQVSLSQDNNTTGQARDHSQKNWEVMLTGLKRLLEGESITGLFAA